MNTPVYHPNRDDLTPVEKELSQLVFMHYRNNSKPDQRSRLSDDFARNLRGDEASIFCIATCLAKMVVPEHADKVGQVTGFYIRPKSDTTIHEGDPDIGSLGDLLNHLMGKVEKVTDVDDLIAANLVSPITDEVQPLVLWAKAFDVLKGFHTDVAFDADYTKTEEGYPRPAIRGEGVNPMVVNGAILDVLSSYGELADIDHTWLATEQDEKGWVYTVTTDD